ncbi:hypothetical protein BH10PSE19_BH10PSE19_19430 [soil metagenome]
MNEITTNNFSKLKKTDHEFIDETMELIRNWYEYYSVKFLESDIATSLSEKQRDELPFVLSSFCDFCYSYHLQKPGQWTVSTVEDVCVNIMPRKIMADDTFFSAIVPVLCNFFDWMSSENCLPDTQALKKALLSIEPRILSNTKNSNNWGIGKSILMGAAAKGYDMQNPDAIKAALTYENLDTLLTESVVNEKTSYPKQAAEVKTLQDIINDLRYLTQGFPKAAVQAAIQHQHEITPLLLNLLTDTIENYESLESDSMGHLYAMFLLAQFREKAAFPLIIKLASLPGDAPDEIFGDSITEDLHRAIASVYNNDIVAIQQLIENPSLCEWSRSAGIKSLLVLVKEGVLEREQVIHYFKGLFTHPAFINDEVATTNLANACCDMHPAELYNEIKAAFDRNMVDNSFFDMRWVDSVLTMSQENAIKKYLDEHHDYINNTVEEMQWWACFKQQENENPSNLLELHKSKQISPSNTNNIQHTHKTPKVGRNEPCPCGSNKKFKKCCLTTR